jgi:hypothetical protein
MGHAAFERAKEDIEEHKEWLKEQEELWAAMSSSVDIKYKEVDWKGKLPKRRKGSRIFGTNPRAKGANPRALQASKLHSQASTPCQPS